MTKYYALLTQSGAAKLANAAALGTKLQITQMAVGDGGGALPTPNASQTTLVAEKRRAALNALSIDAANGSQIIAEQIIPEGDGGFWIREIGLFDADGVLIAVANCPETYKPQLQEGSGRTQTVRMILIVNSTEAVTLKIDPSVVLATRKYVDDRTAEARAYGDSLMQQHTGSSDPHVQYAKKNGQELAGKMNTSSNGSDIQDVATFLKNLGLGDAAKRGVGSGDLHIPDMSYFARGPGWHTLPNGKLFQWGIASSSADAGVLISFPVSFAITPDSVLATSADVDKPNLISAARYTNSAFLLSAWDRNIVRAATAVNWYAVGDKQ